MSTRFLIAPVLLLSLLFPGAAVAGPFSNLTLVYEANFDDGTLNPSFDTLGVGPMQIGDTLVPGTNPSAVLQNGGVTLSITRPSGAPVGPVAVGAVATPVSFGLGSILGARAVFTQPMGPHGATDSWAAAMLVRTGSVSDVPAALRAAATFQVNGNGAKLNTPFASTPAGLPNIPQSVYDAIFSPANADPATFTLDFLIDRTTGFGYASLTSGAFSASRANFTFMNFGSNFGSTITALEPGIAIANGPDTTASVRLLDFQVFTQIPEPPTWAIFGCGLILLGVGKSRAPRRIYMRHFLRASVLALRISAVASTGALATPMLTVNGQGVVSGASGVVVGGISTTSRWNRGLAVLCFLGVRFSHLALWARHSLRRHCRLLYLDRPT